MEDQTNVLPEGEFKAEITLSGGTGRTTVKSPANVSIEDDVIIAEIIWSSPYYDLMIIGDKEYKPVLNDENSSVFMLPIPYLDTPLNIKAETVAMSTPHLIDYTITVSGEEILKDQSNVDTITGFTSKVHIGTGSSAVNADPKTSGGLPPLAIIGISAALGAAVAYAGVTVWNKSKKGKK